MVEKCNKILNIGERRFQECWRRSRWRICGPRHQVSSLWTRMMLGGPYTSILADASQSRDPTRTHLHSNRIRPALRCISWLQLIPRLSKGKTMSTNFTRVMIYPVFVFSPWCGGGYWKTSAWWERSGKDQHPWLSENKFKISESEKTGMDSGPPPKKSWSFCSSTIPNRETDIDRTVLVVSGLIEL